MQPGCWTALSSERSHLRAATSAARHALRDLCLALKLLREFWLMCVRAWLTPSAPLFLKHWRSLHGHGCCWVLQAEMVFPELMRDAVVSKGDHQILLAAKYMQEVKYKSDSRVRVVGSQIHTCAASSPLVSSAGHHDR